MAYVFQGYEKRGQNSKVKISDWYNNSMIYFCYLFFQAIVTTSFSAIPSVAGVFQVSNINLDPCPQFSIMCLPLKKEHQHKWVCLKISLCKPILSFCRWTVQKIISAARNKSPNRTTSPPVLTQLFVLLLPLPMLPPKVSPRSIWIGGGWVIADIMVALVLNMSATKRKTPPGKVIARHGTTNFVFSFSLSNLCQGYEKAPCGEDRQSLCSSGGKWPHHNSHVAVPQSVSRYLTWCPFASLWSNLLWCFTPLKTNMTMGKSIWVDVSPLKPWWFSIAIFILLILESLPIKKYGSSKFQVNCQGSRWMPPLNIAFHRWIIIKSKAIANPPNKGGHVTNPGT